MTMITVSVSICKFEISMGGTLLCSSRLTTVLVAFGMQDW